MTRRSRKSRKLGIVVLIGIVVFVGAAVGAFYLVDRHVPEEPKGKVRVTSSPVVTLTEHREVTIYISKETATGFYLVPRKVKTQQKGSRLDVALIELLTAGQTGGKAAGLIPDGTKLRKPIRIEGEVAVVDLSKQFLENFNGGSYQEAMTLNAIAHTLVTNSGGKIKRVQILVEGEPAETLGGHFDLSEPIRADSTLLKPQ
ncbi:MAG: GerMN domain-containing protein [Armatimonadota bacterium]